MRCLVVDNGSLTTHLIARRAERLGWRATVVPHRRSPLQIEPDAWDAVVLSGTEVPVTTGRFDRQLEPLAVCPVPLLGICGGLHLIARAHGVGLAEQEPVVGRTEVWLAPGAPLFAGLPSTMQLFQRHRYRLERVPPGFVRIAGSRSCPTEAIAHSSRPLFGIQGHVELRADGERILRRFFALSAATSAGRSREEQIHA